MQVKTMNEDKVLELRERLSALADGELGGDDVAQLMAVPSMDEDVQGTWHAYHLIGDVLRGGDQAVRPGASGFLSRLQTRLQAEEPLVPARPIVVQAEPSAIVAGAVAATESANDANFRWKMVAGCASFAAVVAMVWGVVGGAAPAESQPQLAVAPPAVQQSVVPTVAEAFATVEQRVELPNGEAQIMIRDPRLDELLTAHKQAGGGTALQMPAGFLRSATFATPER